MAEINANSLPAKTELGANDSAIVVDQTSNAGALVDLDVLADKVLDRISSKTYANQVGGSSAATLLAQLSTLNSNSLYQYVGALANGVYLFQLGKLRVINFINADLAQITYPTLPEGHRPIYDSSMTCLYIESGTYKRYIANVTAKTSGAIGITHLTAWGSTSSTTIDPENASGWISGQVWYVSGT